MNPPNQESANHRSVRLACIVLFVLLAPLTVGACSHAAAPRPTKAAAVPTAHATMAATMAAPGAPTSATTTAQIAEVRAAAWQTRPTYTHSSARTEQAYQYALDHPEVLQWIPCYCGCGAMGHRSNLDCYFKPRSDGSISFEEHASYCGICVDITLRVKQMVASGASLGSVRDAIDAEFGGTGPGTDTVRPVS